VPVLIRGETGTGRGLVARYLHFFGGSGRGALTHVPCSEHTTAADISSALTRVRATRPGLPSLAIWLENAERLRPANQRQLLAWLEFGPPDGAAGAPLVRWIATVGEDGLDPELRIALGGLAVALPTLRERPVAIGRIAWETARAWCAARQERPRRFGEDALAVMEEYPWPGNVRELEALVVQSLAATTSDPLRADDLQLGGVAFAPLDVGEIGTLVEESLPSPEGGLDEPSVTEIDELLEGMAPPDTAEPALTTPPLPDEQGALTRLVHALSHERPDPLATLRTFAELLPERFDDERFRDRFAERVREDAGRIEALGRRLAGIANLERPERNKVDVAGLLEELLDQRRQKIRDQRLLVLKELDTSEPHALCDRAQLHFALDTLLGKALEWVPTNGDVYLASRHHPGAPGEGPSVRVLVRFHDPQGGKDPSPERAVMEGSLELLIAEVVVRAQGGSLSVASTDGEETVIVIDLPA
jgi:signal transduction histidine kinase